ncbi:hypothetical protein D3H55_11270, partial [Bacillus salacetis]
MKRLFSHILMLSEKIPGAGLSPVFEGFTLEKERAALFLLITGVITTIYQDFILKFVLNSNKFYEKIH